MRLFHYCFAITLLAAQGITNPASATDWPQWQGVNRNGMSQDRGLLQAWPDGGPPLAWKAIGLGGGDSAPAVADGRLYGMSNRGDQEIVWALSESDGKAIWVRALGPAVQTQFPQSKEGPGGTPTVDQDRLYVLGVGGALACLRVADGEIVWQRSLTKEFGGVLPMWSYRESPLVDGDKLICTPGGKDTTIVALNKMTGETIWKNQPPTATPAGGDSPAPRGGFGHGAGSGAGYSSPIAIDFGGKRQYLQVTAKALVGIDAADGTQLWQYTKPANSMGINCTTPLFHDGTVFASSAYGAGGGAVKLSAKPDGSIDATEVYFVRRLQNHHGGIILLDGCLYGANGGNGGGNLICIDFENGAVLWDERSGERRIPKGSIAYADGRLYYRTEEGAMLLIEPSREKYIERGRFEQPDRTNLPAWSHPVVANGKLYVRDQDTLYCYDIKAK